MSKRTVGRKLAREFWGKSLGIEAHADRIDALVRREKAKAWDECYVRICESDLCIAADLKIPRDANPYRGKAKR